MKKLSGILSLTIVLAGFSFLTSCNNTSTSSGSNFEGVVSYEIKSDSGLPPEAEAMFKNVEMKTFVKGNLTRSEEKMAGYNTVILSDRKTPDDPTMLINMFNHKYAVKLTDSLKKIAAASTPKIEYIDSANATKQIAGYACKKAKITVTLPNSPAPITSYVYYTTDLPYADPKGQFKGLKGMPMEFTISMASINLTIEAKSVEKKTLADSLFNVPADYKQTTIADMEKDLMKSMPAQNQNPGSDSAAGSNGTK